MLLKSVNSRLLCFSLIVLFLFSFFLFLADSSITFCTDFATQTSASAPAKIQPSIMDGMNCHYQFDPFTKQPIANKDGSLAPPVCKTNFGFMMDALRDMALSAQQQKDFSSTS